VDGRSAAIRKFREPIAPSQGTIAILAALSLLFVCNGCGRSDAGDGTSELAADELYNAIEPGPVARKVPNSPPRLGSLSDDIVPAALRTAPCRLRRGNSLLLVANRMGAAARVDGRVIVLTAEGPVGSSGGYFTAPRITISVGATPPRTGRGSGSAAEARVSIGGAPDRPVEKVDARWSCPLAG
jgi:hypothetical protein